jgi:tetratricopeptide (TPR) repeat protein
LCHRAPLRRPAWLVRAAGNSTRGIALYERALAHKPGHAEALYNLGVACGEAGQRERALFMYQLAVHFQPACAEALNNMGVIHRDLGNLVRAEECYRAALQIRPNFPQVGGHTALGAALSGSGSFGHGPWCLSSRGRAAHAALPAPGLRCGCSWRFSRPLQGLWAVRHTMDCAAEEACRRQHARTV